MTYPKITQKDPVIGLDSGHGVDKIAYRDEDGNIVFRKEISAIADAPLEADDMPLFEGKRYYVGSMALMEDSSKIKNVIDYKEHETFVPLSVWHMFKTLDIKPDIIKKLAIGLSLAQKDYAKSFVARVTKFVISGEKFDLTDKIALLPQAIGAKYAIDHFYFNGPNTETYAIIDIGQLTVDKATVVEGKVRRENASGSSSNGIIKIVEELREYIGDQDNFGDLLAIKEVQEILLSNKYISYGEEYDLSEVIFKLKKDYTKYIMTTLQQTDKNIFKKFNKIFFVGGGAYYIILDDIAQMTGVPLKAIIIPENPEFLNAIGNMLAAEMA